MNTLAQVQGDRTAVRGLETHGTAAPDRVHLQCARCGNEMKYTAPVDNCPACGWEWLDMAYRGLTRENIVSNSDALGRTSMWRYRKFLPVLEDRNIVSMGEGMTPLLRVDRLAARLGLHNVYIKVF